MAPRRFYDRSRDLRVLAPQYSTEGIVCGSVCSIVSSVDYHEVLTSLACTVRLL
jgi:hypothetical protein